MINIEQAKRYCYQDISLIENYEEAVKDTEHKWVCHHRVETIMNCGKKELKSVGAYYKRPAQELIFLRHDEHMRLHHKGKKLSEETKLKLSEAHKGEKHSNFGKKHSADTIKRMSEAMKRRWAERRNSIINNV